MVETLGEKIRDHRFLRLVGQMRTTTCVGPTATA
jgi:hypothetical protein